MDEYGVNCRQLYSGVFFAGSTLHMTFNYQPEVVDSVDGKLEPTLPDEVQQGYIWSEDRPLQEVFIYGMIALEDINAYACYINTPSYTIPNNGKILRGNQYKFQHNSDTPLHITLNTGKGVSPVESGLRLKQYIREAWENDEPDMHGYIRFPKLIRWIGYWDIMTDKGSYYEFCHNAHLESLEK